MGGLLVFLGVLGGIEVFGLLGLVLGPVVLAMAAILLEVYAPPPPHRDVRNDGSGQGGKNIRAVLE